MRGVACHPKSPGTGSGGVRERSVTVRQVYEGYSTARQRRRTHHHAGASGRDERLKPYVRHRTERLAWQDDNLNPGRATCILGITRFKEKNHDPNEKVACRDCRMPIAA